MLKNTINFRRNSELPLSLDLGGFFDYVFGELTRHDVYIKSDFEIKVLCQNCPYSSMESSDICESHIGILEGVIKARIGSEATSMRNVDDSQRCHLTFSIE